MYCSPSLLDLKAEINRRDASVKERKRLEFDDKNITPQHSPSPVPSMVLPSLDMYHDINSNSKLPPFDCKNLRSYFERFNKTTDTLKKLYESRCLVLIRSAFLDNYYYIRGHVRKNLNTLQYEVDAKIDESGVIEECHCECPTGAGKEAHCKHVGVVLYAVLHMVKYKRIITAETISQTFSKQRYFSGSPVKAEDLSDRKHRRSVIFEPYPISKIDKKSYNEKFRNLVLNFKSNMPIKQLYDPVAMSKDQCYHQND